MASLRLCGPLVLLLLIAPVEAQLGGKLGGRKGGAKRLKRARPKVVAAIGAGLDWLAQHQDKDGKIDAVRFVVHDQGLKPTTGPALKMSTPAVTAFAVHAFLGNGNTLAEGPHKDALGKATVWLLAQIQKDGSFRGLTKEHEIAEHAVIAHALLEATASSRLGKELDKACTTLDWLVERELDGGGFGTNSKAKTHDLLAMHFAILALRISGDFKRGLHRQVCNDAHAMLLAQSDTEGRFAENPRAAPWRASKDANLPLGLFTRFFLGMHPKKHESMQAMIDALAANPPKPKLIDKDILRTWIGTGAIYQAGGKGWQNWSKVVMPQLVKSQRQDGNFKGSWDPKGEGGKVGGRVYQTALSILTLQTYYRYTRLVR